MATQTEIVTRSLRRLGVIAAGDTPAHADMESGKEALTAMINAWEAEGLSGDIIPLDARFEQGIVALLAVRLAEEYGKAPSEVLARDAKLGQQKLRAAFLVAKDASFDAGLVSTSRRLQANTPQPWETWQASTAYVLRQYVVNGSNLYECITEGTSASSGGPTGTDAVITDGTVEWCWRRVAGEPEA